MAATPKPKKTPLHATKEYQSHVDNSAKGRKADKEYVKRGGKSAMSGTGKAGSKLVRNNPELWKEVVKKHGYKES